jgi:putative SOS response-associated peptidase YedK
MSVSGLRLSQQFPFADFPLTVEPRYNIAPTQHVLAVVDAGDRARGELVRWGLGLPAPSERSLFNLRSETALGGGLWRQLLRDGRILLPASHFYEWTGSGSRRRPLMIGPAGDGVLALAGLLGHWTNPETGLTMPAAVILTCAPNETMRPIHHRMPVILDPDGWRAWMDPRTSPQRIEELLTRAAERAPALRVAPVSRLVNDHRNEGPQLLTPEVEPEAPPPQLDLPFSD